MTRRTSDDEPVGHGHRRDDPERHDPAWPDGDPEVAWTPADVGSREAGHDEPWWDDDDHAWPTDEDDEWPVPPAVSRGAALGAGDWRADLTDADAHMLDLTQPDEGVLDLTEPDEGVLDLAGPDDDLPDCPSEPLTTPAATLECLLALVGPERHGPSAIWLLPVDAERHTLPFVLPVVEVPERADERVAARLVDAVAAVLQASVAGGAIVVGLVRASGGDRGAFETSWARALRDAADELGVDVHAVVAVGSGRARVLEW